MTTTKPLLKKFLLHDIEHYSKSILMQDIFYKILHLAKLDSNVILVGEIGSGKKRLAKVIHESSNRAQGSFQTFYCLNINEDEYKKAFWGHLKFDENHLSIKYDLLEKTINGTLYLDQFSELTPKLMHDILISYKKGCDQIFRLRPSHNGKPRIILSFNQEYYQNFIGKPIWQELLNELNPVVIMLPPLRDHKEDIPLIIDHFLNEIRDRYIEYKNLRISGNALLACYNYDWPGNLLQLKNAILQGAVLSRGETIELSHLPISMNTE
ncbi:sigma 54-interacting transcriptional regulator [Fodinibius salsisoli]|uniref:Sigma-54-dependent Fis family transcriptional regulator n=1 Tax=Fodinibius salsisoli TaxID=2820877 RepID=A0ABT3PLD3_9BACT|nr:sigma 54-interacting transcriptional regulator [Fodinibius salsisoli]MCW9706741.1 sigma-54-dependent Fis family transcriptional regulator [Fodinibius salsisoli]